MMSKQDLTEKAVFMYIHVTCRWKNAFWVIPLGPWKGLNGHRLLYTTTKQMLTSLSRINHKNTYIQKDGSRTRGQFANELYRWNTYSAESQGMVAPLILLFISGVIDHAQFLQKYLWFNVI